MAKRAKDRKPPRSMLRASSTPPPPPNELQLAEAVLKRVAASHQIGIDLLLAMTTAATNDMARLTAGVRIRVLEDHFRLQMVALSINAAWCISSMIMRGYPRMALANARLLREGHIAVLWAKVDPESARAAFNRVMSGEDGRWPKAGEMAAAVEADLKSSSSANLARWSPFMKAVGDTHNQEFAHAVTDFAISTGMRMDGDSVAPPVGPTYLPELTQAAIDHMVPLFKLVLSDAANLSEELGEFSRSDETSQLLDRADQYWQGNPIPLSTVPNYTTEAENLP